VPGLSIHVVDVSRGVVCRGMKLELLHAGRRIAEGAASEKGLFEVGARLDPGVYEALMHVGAWYRAEKIALPEVPFLDLVTYRFGIADPEQHYHLPFKCTPWGYSCFRGGA
jgi:5-hydroxyisourate hydrolase